MLLAEARCGASVGRSLIGGDESCVSYTHECARPSRQLPQPAADCANHTRPGVISSPPRYINVSSVDKFPAKSARE